MSAAQASTTRVDATAAAHAAILAEVPVSNLVTPMWHVGLSDRVIAKYEPWGSDYYVIRADEFLTQPSPTIVVGKTFKASALDPRSGSTAWSLTSHGISEKLFTVDKHGEIVPQVAESCTKVTLQRFKIKTSLEVARFFQ